MVISPGATATRQYTVTDADSAVALGSGDVPVLATPRLIAWCEAVTVLAAADGLDEAETTVGTKVDIDHLLPTPIGATVTVTAEVTSVNRRRVTFGVTVEDHNGTAASGTVVRAAVDRQTFIDRLVS
ncbi:MAG: thioesterase family protein [Actinomycetota bacterium]